MRVVVDLAALATLLFANITNVRVTEQKHTTEEQTEITFSAVVKGVGLVPVGESSSVLMGNGSFISNLHVSVCSIIP